MTIQGNKLKAIFIAMMVLLAACSGKATAPATEAPAIVPPTEVVSAPIPTETPAVTHAIIPVSLPVEHSNHAGDYDSSTTADRKEAPGGDRFTYGMFERPFNATTMDIYFPNLDIVDLTVFKDDTWSYASIVLKGPDANGQMQGRYALEIDVDGAGRGDFLLIASNPSSTDWSTQGVQVWADANHDVGGSAGGVADEHPQPGDGFETLVFDSDKGSDPDSAWVRISPDDPNTVELAIKNSVLGNDPEFMVRAWAGSGALDPSKFDINDHMTHEQAGASVSGYAVFYPIKGLSEIDNTCRVPVGFAATGSEPGLCPVLIPEQSPLVPVPGNPPAPSCPNVCSFGQMPYPDCMCIPG